MKSNYQNTNRGFISLFVVLAVIVLAGVGLYFSTSKNNSAPVAISIPQNNNQSANVAVSFTDTATTTETASTTTPVVIDSTPKVVLKPEIIPPATAPKVVVPKPKPAPVIIVPEVKKTPVLIVTAGEPVSSSLLVHDAQYVPFENVDLEAQNGDITVNHITIKRTGFGSDDIFSAIGVNDGTGEFERSADSNHFYTTRVPFTIKAGEKQSIQLFGDIASDLTSFEGQTPSLTLVSIDANAPVQGELPITSPLQTVNPSINIGTINLTSDSFDPAMNRTLYINDKNVIFSAVKVNLSGEEPINLNYVIWTQSGSASKVDISNIRTILVYKDKTYVFPTNASDDGKKYTADMGDGIVIGKGDNADLYVEGDIGTTGADRTVDFDIYGTYDVAGVGKTYGQNIVSYGGDTDGVASEGQFSTTMYPFYNGFAHTISAGTATVIGR